MSNLPRNSPTDAEKYPVMENMTAVKKGNEVFIENISEHNEEIVPIKARISKDTGKIFVAGEMLSKLEGVILKFWTFNKLISEDKQIVCMGVNGMPIVSNSISPSCANCPKNKFVNHHKECKNYYVLLIKSPEYSIPIKISIPPTNLRDFKAILQIPLAKVKPLSQYTAIFTPNKKEGKNNIVYYNYNIELEENNKEKEWLTDYMEYANHYYDYISSNRYDTSNVVVKDDEETATTDEQVPDDLPF